MRFTEFVDERCIAMQPHRCARIDALFLAGPVPGPAQPVVAARVPAQHFRRRVMQEPAEGRRTPDHTVAQRRFNFAFILIVPLFHVTGCVPVMLSCWASGLKLVIRLENR